MNQALEDAVELAQAIQEGGLTQGSLRAYEASRIPRVQQILAAEMVSLTPGFHITDGIACQMRSLGLNWQRMEATIHLQSI